MNDITEKLVNIGFNKLEADVYIYLLSNPPATAYKIGKQINKPTANVYKAIDSLSLKGAVIVEDNKNKLCKAINPEEFIKLYEKEILERTQKAKITLGNLKNEHQDQRSYSIESVPLVFERFNTMMKKCTTIAVVDAFPKALEKVVDCIEEAIQRGVEVYVEAYRPIEIKGANIICANIGEKALKYWKSQQLNLVIDGEEHLMALMDDDLENVKQATWSNNIYSSCILHAGRLHEQTVMKISSLAEKENFEQQVKEIIKKQKFFFNTKVPGFNKLFKK